MKNPRFFALTTSFAYQNRVYSSRLFSKSKHIFHNNIPILIFRAYRRRDTVSRQMAANPLSMPSYKLDFETLKPSSLFLKPSELRFSKDKNKIKCELNSFGNPQKWSLDRVSETDHLHIIQSSISSSVPMVTNVLDSSSQKSSKKVCLFYCAETKSLAERVALESDSIELRSISWRTFEDGFPNLFISNAHGIRGQHVAFLASFSSPAVIFEQLSVIYALPKLFISSFTLVLPFFPTGTSERVEEEGDIATAFTLARILSNIPISRGGPSSLVIFDIHALQERFYFGDNVLPCFESGIPLLKNRLQQLPDSDNISIAFPDDGAWKRFHKQLQHFPMIICGKVREGNQRIVRLKEGDPRGRHVVIVDDLVQSGGTLIECQKSSKKVCLFYCAETKSLAERVALESDSIELRSIRWRTFEDGFPNLFISNAHGIRGQHVAFLASFSSPAVIFEQLSVIYALPKLFISSFTLVLPFFPTGTSERVEEEGDIATAFTLARILSNIPISRGGPSSLVIFDIHALQERFYFGDNVLPCFESGIPLLKNRLQQLPDSDNISIAFPDDGAWKRFHKQLQHFPMIICGKVREGNQRIVRLKEGDPRGRHVVIVDDLVQSGGTLIECQKVLAAHGAAKISAYVTHGIFPNGSWARFQHDSGGSPENGLTYFWITDSCPSTVKEVKNRQPFEVISLAGAIAAALQI